MYAHSLVRAKSRGLYYAYSKFILTQNRSVLLQALQWVALFLKASDLCPHGAHRLRVCQQEAQQPEGSWTCIALDIRNKRDRLVLRLLQME